MNDTSQQPEKDDVQVAAEITEALAPQPQENDVAAEAVREEADEQKPVIDVAALAQALREAEERGYQRALSERERAVNASRQRAFAMPPSDPTPPATTPTILAGLRPGFWEK